MALAAALPPLEYPAWCHVTMPPRPDPAPCQILYHPTSTHFYAKDIPDFHARAGDSFAVV
jgi:hypothetical protein